MQANRLLSTLLGGVRPTPVKYQASLGGGGIFSQLSGGGRLLWCVCWVDSSDGYNVDDGDCLK